MLYVPTYRDENVGLDDNVHARALAVDRRARLVPRTRSSHEFAAGTVANFGFKNGTRIIMLLVSFRFRSSLRVRGKCLRTSESGH